jgi:UPF0716 family protein affecting phage T7 exclusion
MNLLMRALAIIGGLTLIVPGIATDIIGLALIVVVIVFQKYEPKKAAEAELDA